MTPERYLQVNALTDAALQIRPDQRAAFLDQVCGNDHDLRERINALIEADSETGDFLEKPLLEELAGDMAVRPTQQQQDLTGRRIEHYEVIARLGAGGIGEVWMARDLNLDREIALKLLSPRFAGDPYHMRRFQQEARTASALNHPNIITVYEVGKAEGMLFIAQERVAGETIRQRLARAPIPLKEILKVGAQASAALAAAHSAGIVHRDIKPENVMLRPDGLVKVLDFGLARFVERPAGLPTVATESVSLPGFVLGTVRYMSPEQARGLTVDNRSDIFSLGVMLYEMAAGLPPFSGSTPTDTLAAILTDDPPPLSRRIPGIPAEFERIVRRCLEKDPSARYPSAEALRDDLVRLAEPPLDRAIAPFNTWTITAAASVVLAAVAAAYFLTDRRQPVAVPFNSMQITRLPTGGEAADAAISHDGKLLAYVVNESLGQSVWIRNSSGSTENLVVPPEAGEDSGITFSPDDSFLYYRRKGREDSGDLYRVPLKNGSPERVLSEVTGSVALSPDGRRLAFVRLKPSAWEASLVVSNIDGSGESTFATLRRPRYLDQHSVAWSPDGLAMACFSGAAARYSETFFQLIEIRLSDRSQHVITRRSWAWPNSIAWSPKGDILIITAASRGDDIYQLWMVSHKTGAVTRLTNDLSNYGRVTLTNDGKSLATVQSENSSAIWVTPRGRASQATRINLAPLHSTHTTLAWTPAGRLIYSDPTGDYRNLWLVDADSGSRQRLTSGASNNKDQIVIARTGRYIVYKQEGNIWRMDADGTNARQLTHGPLDVHPDITPDGRAVLYGSFVDWSPGVGGEPSLWQIPIDGGTPAEVSSQPASYPVVSPDGRHIGCIYFPGKDPRFSARHVALLALDGSGGFRIFESSPSDETPISWSPDGKGLDYIVNATGAGNLWRQPTAGGPPIQITKFANDDLSTFAWSRDGRLACVRGTTARDVVLIENFH